MDQNTQPREQPINLGCAPRFSLIGIIRGLLRAENMGDVFDEVFYLCDGVGLTRPELCERDAGHGYLMAGETCDLCAEEQH